MAMAKKKSAEQPPVSKYVKGMTTSELEGAFFSTHLPAEYKMIIAKEYWERTGKQITRIFRY
jgi:hypothetical protein